MSRRACGRVYLLSSVRLGGSLKGTIVSSKTVPEVLNIKYRSEFKHGFTNRGCLHCAILKALRGFQEKKSPQVKGHALFPSKCSK